MMADAEQTLGAEGDLPACVQTLAEGNWLELPDHSAGMTVERIALPNREQFGLLSYRADRSNGTRQGVLCSGNLAAPLIYVSKDQGGTWHAIPLADHLQGPVKRHFLTRSGRHLVQTIAPIETLLLDAEGKPLAHPSILDATWPGSYSIDQASSGTIMIADATTKSRDTVLRSTDDGETWKQVALPRAKGFTTAPQSCQADPHVPGRWYAVGDVFWRSDDDGASWTQLPVKPRDTLADLHALIPKKGLSIGESHLAWLVTGADGQAALARIDKTDNSLEVTALPGTSRPVVYLQLDGPRGVAIADAADEKIGGLATFIDHVEGRLSAIPIRRLSWQRNRLADLASSGTGSGGVFFAGIDSGRPNVLENRTLRVRIGTSAWLADDASRADAAPSSSLTANDWFSDDFGAREDDLVAFFHPQRTAGMSLRNLFIKVYGADRVMSPKTSDQFRNWAEVDAQGLVPFKVYCGHVNFIEKPLGDRRCVPIGMVRNPVDRLVSLYRYIRGRGEGHKLWSLAQTCGIADFYQQAAEVMPEYVMNLQTRRVSGCTNADHAIAYIQRRFLGVGVNEFINDFVAELGRVLGWPTDATITHRNKAQTPLDFEIPDEFHAWVRETNADDWKLYEFVLGFWKARATAR